MAGLTIVTLEGYLVELLLGLPCVSPLESQNPGADLNDTFIGAPLELWLSLKWTGVCVAVAASWIAMKIIDGEGSVFLASLPLELSSHLK